MRRDYISRIIVGLGVAAIVSAGCNGSSRSSSSSDATTPQDKAREEQLSAMAEEDAGDATAAPAKSPKWDSPTSGRRSGQRVVDQPRRR